MFSWRRNRANKKTERPLKKREVVFYYKAKDRKTVLRYNKKAKQKERDGVSKKRKTEEKGTLETIYELQESTINYIEYLANRLHDTENNDEKRFCIEAADVSSRIMAQLLLQNCKTNADFDFLVTLLQDMLGTIETCFSKNKKEEQEHIEWLQREYRSTLNDAKPALGENNFKTLSEDYKKIKDNKIAMQLAMTHILWFGIEFYFRKDNPINNNEEYCQKCVAQKIKQEIVGKIPEMFENRFACINFANGLIALSRNQNIPTDEARKFFERAENFKLFATVDAEEIENFDEIVEVLAMDYACVKTEVAALLRMNKITFKDTLFLGLPANELEEFAQTKEIKDYIEGAIGERIDDNVQKKRGRQKTAEKAI